MVHQPNKWGFSDKLAGILRNRGKVNKIHPTKVFKNVRFMSQAAECLGVPERREWAQEKRLRHTSHEIVPVS